VTFVAAFDLLHPGLQHHVVNSLGWRELRPFQEDVIPVVLRGDSVVVIAPTAGGKTEAAVLPILSRMLSEDWRGLSVIYLCPIRALLNNLHIRLERYAKLVGRTCSVWHGDTSPTERARINREQPDILLTTPESLEVMLVSLKTDPVALFASTWAVIVDELHAFAGDDRGWHMLSVLQRVSRLAGRDLQRIGLSATIGNPDQLLRWLTAGSERPSSVVLPPAGPVKQANVQLDFVGSIKNAAVVISRLHRGEKRLVFVDSRARAEELGAALQQLETKVFVTHSSLSKDQRNRAERAFASETDCVIVATSVLELGVDVGDLDRVIQIDSPSTVASFLQRMGRTGRRENADRNCLFLATQDFALLQAAALLGLWSDGYVEEVIPPPIPYHVFVQQILTLTLQESNFVRSDWPAWIGKVQAFTEMQDGRADTIIDHALATHLLGEDGGRLHLGIEAERRLGHRHFSELLSVVTSQPLFQVRFGRLEVGFVHPLSFTAPKDGPAILALGGRGWRILHLDWNRKIAHVEPAEESGRSRWLGSSAPLSPTLCGAVRKLLQSSDRSPMWSRRAIDQISQLRQNLSHCCAEDSVVARRGLSIEWWTFAGLATNQTVVQYLQPHFESQFRADNLWITIPSDISIERLNLAIDELRLVDSLPDWDLQKPARDLLKFGDLLPDNLLRDLILARISDVPRAQGILRSPIRVVEIDEE
jgi:ATP-dependent Lhr-like helicase